MKHKGMQTKVISPEAYRGPGSGYEHKPRTTSYRMSFAMYAGLMEGAARSRRGKPLNPLPDMKALVAHVNKSFGLLWPVTSIEII